MAHELRKRSQRSHPLSIPGGTAWDSDEHILVQQDGNNNGLENSNGRRNYHNQTGHDGITKEITVVQETVVQSELVEDQSASSPTVRDTNTPHLGKALSNFESSVTSKPKPRGW